MTNAEKINFSDSIGGELCPYCDHENLFTIGIFKKTLYCQMCGKLIKICSECESKMCGKCNDYN